jgi:hypothetical protein
MLVERNAFRHLANGSYEEKRSKVVEAVREWLSEKNVQSAANFKLVASFPNHAIIVNEANGKTYQYSLENKANGTLAVIGSIGIKGPRVYAETEKTEYMSSKVTEAVKSLSSGILSSDKVATLMMEVENIDTASPIIRQLQSLIEGDNLWDKYYSLKVSSILRETWDVKTLIESRSDCDDSIHTAISRMAALRRRINPFQHRTHLSSADTWLRESSYWSENLLEAKVDSYKYSDFLKSLVECLTKIDQIISYEESGRATR